MADYKILQNIDLAQNEIKEVSKIANDREDGKDKGLLIQTGNDTSLAFNRKIEKTKTINSIKGTVKDGTKESTLNIEPSKVSISNTKGTTSLSSFVLGLDSKGNEHIEAVSPSIDIKTGKTRDTDYTHPYISLKEEGSKLELQSETVEIRSEGNTKSSLTMDGGITGVSNSISLKDSSEKSSEKVSLNLNSDGTNGTISESASKSITETVGTRSVSLDTTSIKIEDSTTTGTPSIIEVNDNGIKASKGSDSYIDISYNDIEKQVEIEEQSKKVTIKTPNKVTLTLDDNASYSASLTSKEAIKFTSSEGNLNETSTLYGVNVIESKANNIKLHTIGYTSTEATKYHPHIELQSNNNNDSILLEGKTINIFSKDKETEEEVLDKDKKDSITISSTTLNINDNINTFITSKEAVGITGTERITETSKDITLKDSSNKVSLNLNSNGIDGTISESASKSITETVDDTVSLTLEKNADSTHSITLENKKEPDTPSIIEVNDKGIKASKSSDSSDSYIDIQSNTIEEKSRNVTIKTPDSVTLILDENIDKTKSSASLTSTGKITLTSQGDATTEYGNNDITTTADTITIKAKSYKGKGTEYYPHIKLESNASKNSVLLEGKTINISSKDKDSNKDTITLSGTKLNIESTTTEITSDAINIKNNAGTKEVLTLNTTTPSISIPSDTETDINSKTIGLGYKDNNSTTTVSGSNFNVETTNTNITSTTIVSGKTTIQSSDSNPVNTIVVDGTSTSITGSQADINPANVNIGAVDSSKVTIGKDNTNNTTTLKSSTTEITSSTLNIESNKVDFTKTNQEIIFEGAGGSVTSKEVPIVAEDTTVSVKRGTDEVFKVDTSSEETSTTINGKIATINPVTVNIGEKTTNAIKIGRNDAGTTTLRSSTTNITSPTINIGTDTSSSSVSIGKASSDVNLTGNHNLSMTSGESESEVGATNLRFDNKIYSNNIKIRWDSALNSLVFEKA